MSDMDILVIGSGVSGLTCAVRLLEARHRVAIWAREPAAHTTSSVAAAIWYPYAVAAANASAWGNESFHIFQDLAEHDPMSGLVLRDLLYLERHTFPNPDWADEVRARAATRAELPTGYASGLAFRAPVIDMSLYLTYLEARVRALGGRIQLRAIADWDDAFANWSEAFGDVTADEPGARVVVNCAGLAARALVADDRNDSADGLGVRPARGQVVRIERGPIDFTHALLDESDEARPTYIVPRINDIVLGGTNQVGKEMRAVDLAVRDDIITRCATLALHYDPRFAMSLAGLVGGAVAERFRAQVGAEAAATPPARLRPGAKGDDCGLRPVRAEVCLKRQTYAPDRYVVHNYGHGGAGVTLSWGCASEVVSLVAALGE